MPLPQGYPGGDAAFFRGEPFWEACRLQRGWFHRDLGTGCMGGLLGKGLGRFPPGFKTSGWFTLADMKQGLLSVGIGGRESRTGCLDVEKGESREYWKVMVQGPLRGPEGALRLSSARRLLHYQVPEPHPGAGGAQAECSVPVFL